MSLEPGTQIGQYRVERRLGGGGMGEVYLARDSRLDRLVAIKFLAAPSDVQGRRRLLREARAAASLDHPNICAVYEVGSDAVGGDFIAMQYVEGDTLATRLRKGRMRPDEALNLGAQIAEALMAAHRRGMVHRDLKPQNIILTPSGAAKLLDFGLATYAPLTPGAANAATTSQVTDPHTVVGTPGYMAPEQIRNEPADFRSDVFALGSVLYECLTGHRAFPGATTAETLGNVLHVDPPAVSNALPELGPAYDVLCARLLHKFPDERFQSAEEVLGAIRGLTPSARFSASSAAIPARRRPIRPRVAAAIAAAAVVVGAYIWWPRTSVLPQAPREAATWYDAGVEAMRDGTYAAARAAFTAAIGAFHDYPQAYWRLAEAHIALDDEKSAGDALVQAGRLVPNRTRLDAEDSLRYDAAAAAAVRQREDALNAYRQLADRRPNDAGRWIDLGRAQEVAGHRPEAVAAYEKAVAVDGLSPAARLRLGVLQTRTGRTAEGLASIDQALEQYRRLGKTEGEAEALLQKGLARLPSGKPDEVRAIFEQVIQLAAGARYPAQRVGAQFGLAKIAYSGGQATQAEELAKRAVADATTASLPTLAASGLIDIGGFLLGKGLFDQAEAKLAQGVSMAAERGATRTENRGKLNQASVRIQQERPDDAVSLATAPAEYFKKTGETGLLMDADLILSRAYEALGQLDKASALSDEAYAFARKAGNNARMGFALENRAGQLEKQGRLPEAAGVRQQIVDFHRSINDKSSLPKDLTNLAENLILLGRVPEALPLLQEMEQMIGRGEELSIERRARLAQLKLLIAVTECRWKDVEPLAESVRAAAPQKKPDGLPLSAPAGWARILSEFAAAQQGRSKTDPIAISKWPGAADNGADRREWGYWSAHILLLRNQPGLAAEVIKTTYDDPLTRANPELSWRLAAVQEEAERRAPRPENGASIPAQAKAIVDQIKAAWAGATKNYLARPDLAALMKTVR